jgi:hypothetical protein
MIRGNASGSSLEEFRKRVGFINLPVPFIGCVNHFSIHKISNSSEMSKWATFDKYYDRPIPRRILEEAGVPGHLFGQKKIAISTHFRYTGIEGSAPERALSEKSYSAFCDFIKHFPTMENFFERFFSRLKVGIYRINYRIVHSEKIRFLCRKMGIKPLQDIYISEKYRKKVTKNCLLFYWAVSELKQRYGLDASVCRR